MIALFGNIVGWHLAQATERSKLRSWRKTYRLKEHMRDEFRSVTLVHHARQIGDVR